MKNVSTTMKKFVKNFSWMLIGLPVLMGAIYKDSYRVKAIASYDRHKGIFVSVNDFMDIDRALLRNMEFQFHFCPVDEKVFRAQSNWSRSPSFFYDQARRGIWYKIKIAYQIRENDIITDVGFLKLDSSLRGFRPRTEMINGELQPILPQAFAPDKKTIFDTYLRSYLDQSEILESDKCYGLSFLAQSPNAYSIHSGKTQEADLVEVPEEEKSIPAIFNLFEATTELFHKGKAIYSMLSPKWVIQDSEATQNFFNQKYEKLILLSRIEVRDIPRSFQNTGDRMYVPGIKLNIQKDQSSSILSNQYATIDKYINTPGIHIWSEIPCSENIDTDLILETQSALKALGYYQEVENGKFDSYTKLSITKFQMERGLPIGNLDLETLSSLGIRY